MIDLTPAQARVHRFICEYIRDNKISPTIREIRNGTTGPGSWVNGVNGHIAALEKKGIIRRNAHYKARSITVLVDFVSALPREDADVVVRSVCHAIRSLIDADKNDNFLSRGAVKDIIGRVEAGAWRTQ